MKLFARTPKNVLKSIVFTDGTVKSLAQNGDQLSLAFVDYCDSLVEISFVGVSCLLVDEHIVGMEIMEALFRWTGDFWVASFKDDDDETILEFSYESATVKGKDNRGQ